MQQKVGYNYITAADVVVFADKYSYSEGSITTI